MTNIEIRRLTGPEVKAAFAIVHELRTHLDEAEYMRLVEAQAAQGYELIGAFRADKLVGIAGMRPVLTLARGHHLHLDDLVVTNAARRTGVGEALLAFAEADAQRRSLGKLFLDARQDAIPFYEKNGYQFHQAPLMRKDL